MIELDRYKELAVRFRSGSTELDDRLGITYTVDKRTMFPKLPDLLGL